MYVILERSRLRSLGSTIRDAIIVGVPATWEDACAAADEYSDDGLSAVAVCTETGRVYHAGGAETMADWIHTPDMAYDGMSVSEYLEMKVAR